MTDTWTPACVLCHRELEAGHCCARCRDRLARQLAEIPALAEEAAAWIDRPRQRLGSSATAYASKPPLDVDCLQPALALIELNVGDPSSAVTIVAALEMWERAIREDRRLAPYGPASLARGIAARQAAADDTATLRGICRFLAEQLDWATSEPAFDLEGFADHVRRAAGALRRWDTSHDRAGTRIACPTVLEDGSACGASLRIASDGREVPCRRCGTSWSVEWLIRVAGDDADGWADLEAVCRFSGLHERTIRRWVRAGKVRKRGLLYNVRDVSDATATETSSTMTPTSA